MRSHTQERAQMPLVERIRLFSTVSGGSLYASRIATALYRQFETEGSNPEDKTWRRCFFRYSARWFSSRTSDQRLGLLASISYVNPLAVANPWPVARALWSLDPSALLDFFYYPPLLGLFTNRDFIDDLAYGLETSYCGARAWLVGPKCAPGGRRRFNLGDFQSPAYPRFLLNATAQQTGQPFVLTQHVIWPLEQSDARSSRAPKPPLTLEQLGSSPTQFPLAYAAMASAAFPVATQPVELRRYLIDKTDPVTRPTGEVFQLVDGGVFDNSGLAVMEQFMERLWEVARQRRASIRSITVIAISAEAPTFQTQDASALPEESFLRRKFEVGIPIASALAPVGRTIDILSDTTRREAQARDSIEREFGVRVESVRLRDLDTLQSGSTACAIPDNSQCGCRDADGLAERAWKIPTDYIMSDPNDRILEQSERILLDCRMEGSPAPLAYEITRRLTEPASAGPPS
jgi:hypothetical protein